ncbi:uncharacterized protein BO66DRAFT_396651 [Aspergillus aculeatinus CBS 121060]|uniref:Uncharacterized protein n=1 Tax=Aspergillus aculeatinus CBS 121060 TaxID=1448322 RepID=A0ACD1GRD7_9EURO|nr:hypothetical protein BO66DRAFT_396651 [Aspergillus aculeatinus CBS 121060]RAH63868.1 hypothetical protein BO66DRAFT_396651 [Aspergillus aculeatinus CBS 121060]
MSFAPPPGPPTPSVPEGWKAQFDDRYNQWFFVNLRTGRSQWERPEGPNRTEPEIHGPPSEPPPSYDASGPAEPSSLAAAGDKKTVDSRNPYKPPESAHHNLDDDARLAAQLQAEENARARRRSPASSGGAASDYYTDGSPRQTAGYQSSEPQSQNSSPGPAQQRSKGFFSKLKGKVAGNSGASFPRPQQPVPQQSYGYPQGGYYYGGGGVGAGYASQQTGYGYPSYPPQGSFYPTQQQPQQRRHGMGTAGAAALGVGGGLLGGMLLADAVEDMSHDYGPPPGDYGDDYGGDFGGGDDFGDF